MEEKEKAPKGAVAPQFSPDFLSDLHSRMTTTLSGGSGPDEGMFRRFVDFEVDASICAPGVTSNFMLTLATLLSSQETDATRNAGGDAVKMGMQMAKSSIYAVNGVRVSKGSGHLDVLWEALGPGGRNLVVQMWGDLSAASEDAVGKAKATMRVY